MWSETASQESQQNNMTSTDALETQCLLSTVAENSLLVENSPVLGTMHGEASTHQIESPNNDVKAVGGGCRGNKRLAADADSLSLTDILMEFDMHFGEAISRLASRPTVISQSLSESRRPPSAASSLPANSSDLQGQYIASKSPPNYRETVDDVPFETPTQSRKFVKFSDSNRIRTYGQPSGSGSTVYISAGTRPTALPSIAAYKYYAYPLMSTSSKTSHHVTGMHYGTDTSTKSDAKTKFCDGGTNLDLTNDRNVYDDVEVLPIRDKTANRTASKPASSSSPSVSRGNNGGVEEDDKPDGDDNSSEFAVQRTVALMLSWILTGVLTGIICARLYTWRLHYNVTYEEISRTFVVEGVGTVVGAWLLWAASTVTSSFRGDAMISLAMVMLAAYPCYLNFLYLLTSSLVFGVAKGILFVVRVPILDVDARTVVPLCLLILLLHCRTPRCSTCAETSTNLICSLYIMKRQWNANKSSLCIHLLYISLATGWFISVHLGRSYAEQILVIPVSPPGECDNDGNSITSYVNKTGTTIHDTAQSLDVNITGTSSGTTASLCDEVRLPMLFIPIAFMSLSLAVFFMSLSLCSSCKVLSASMKRRRRRRQQRTSKKKITTKINQPKNFGTANDYVKVDDAFHGKRTTVGLQAGDDVGKSRDDGIAAPDRAIEQEPGKEGERKEPVTRLDVPSMSLRDDDGRSPPAEMSEIKHDIIVTHKWFQGKHTFDVTILMFIYVFHFIPSGIELGVGRFMSIYAGRNRLLLTSTELPLVEDTRVDLFDWSLLLVSTYWGSMIFGRLLSVGVSQHTMSSICFSISCPILQFLAATVLSIYGQRYPSLLWTFVALSGCALAPVSPGAWTWADIFLTAETKSIASGVAMAAIGGSVMTWLTGLGVDYYGSTAVWLMAASASLLAGLLAVPVIARLESHRVGLIEGLRRRGPRSTYV